MSNKYKYLLLLLIVIVLAGAGAFFVLLENKAVAPVVEVKPDIEIFSPKTNEIISSPLKITGVVRGNGWSGFEGQVGTVTLLDGNGKELAKTFLPATTEWTQLPTNFETTLEFTSPETAEGSLVFHNENASGDPIRDKTVTLPVKFK